MNILFPTNLGFQRQVDNFWQKEADAAKTVGFDISILSESHFGSPMSIFNKQSPTLYRGWIVKPSIYQEMDGLNAGLVNSYHDYMWSYNFPEWYAVITKFTPNSLIIEADEVSSLGLESLAKKLSVELGSKPIIIKDYLKSRKHEWYDACFIRDASDVEELIRVMSNFFKLQGKDFYGGLVFRDFLNLKKIGLHPKSKMPLPLEFRTFFIKGKPIFTTPYWSNDVVYPDNIEFPQSDWLQLIGSKIQSPFVALDIAQDENDKWWVIEVNDGGSAGLPDHVNMEEFYSVLYDILNKK